MQKIYSYLDDAKSAYLLKQGIVFFEIKEGELYKISGKNLIVGAGEVIMNLDSSGPLYRAYNFYKDDESKIAEISPANLNKLIYKYSIGYNLNIYFAKMIKMTNEILSKRQARLSEDGIAVHEIAKIYYQVTKGVEDFAKLSRFTDIVEIGQKLRNELIYETGRILSQQKASVELEVKKEKLDEFNISISPNSVICNEGEEGNEMYILNKGRIGVLIQGNQVAEIDKPGAVIGEIALLLGETRTATLKAIDHVTLSVIKKDNLVDFHKNHENIFLQIGITLAKRVHHNFQLIHNIDQQLAENPQEKVAGFLNREKAEKYLKDLHDTVEYVYEEKEYEQLPDLIAKVEECKKKYIHKVKL